MLQILHKIQSEYNDPNQIVGEIISSRQNYFSSSPNLIYRSDHQTISFELFLT